MVYHSQELMPKEYQTHFLCFYIKVQDALELMGD